MNFMRSSLFLVMAKLNKNVGPYGRDWCRHAADRRLKFYSYQQHIVRLLLISFPCFPLVIEYCFSLFHRYRMDLFNDFTQLTCSELPSLWSSELITESIRTKEDGVAVTDVYPRAGKIRL